MSASWFPLQEHCGCSWNPVPSLVQMLREFSSFMGNVICSIHAYSVLGLHEKKKKINRILFLNGNHLDSKTTHCLLEMVHTWVLCPALYLRYFFFCSVPHGDQPFTQLCCYQLCQSISSLVNFKHFFPLCNLFFLFSPLRIEKGMERHV